ncbi:MAG TPA: hypothetical protein VMB34_29895 [Acetobacteraceae bacterium]|nr:hypothetical protein [Acetobacteraceae bacterium]
MATPFLKFCDELRISTPAAVPDVVRRSFGSLVHESVLFLALGYDYWYNPADDKAQGLYQAFLMKGAPLELNLPATTNDNISALYFDPKLSVRKEATNQPVDLKMRAYGGICDGGVANYNLCTKALDAAADGFDPPTKAGIATGVKTGTAGTSGGTRATMVQCYADLRHWWSDADLTRIGLISR